MAITTPRDLTHAVTLFHALSDETRLSILDMLQDEERCVCDLQEELDSAQSRLSFHLKVLRDAGLVTDRKEGRWMYYAIVPDALSAVHDLVVSLHPNGRKKRRSLPTASTCCG
ncbi:MAG: metalloregulator ArsR/SmtB family transcription factor [Gemmatimonadaceae bacterium]